MLFGDVKQARKTGPQLSVLLSYLQTDWPCTPSQVSHVAKQYWESRHILSEVGSLISTGGQIVIPINLRKQIIEKAHEGHLDMTKLKSRARYHMWWPGMKELCKRCDVCAHFTHQQLEEPLMSTSLMAASGFRCHHPHPSAPSGLLHG